MQKEEAKGGLLVLLADLLPPRVQGCVPQPVKLHRVCEEKRSDDTHISLFRAKPCIDLAGNSPHNPDAPLLNDSLYASVSCKQLSSVAPFAAGFFITVQEENRYESGDGEPRCYPGLSRLGNGSTPALLPSLTCAQPSRALPASSWPLPVSDLSDPFSV
ncbi:hypothetical protein VTI74DRAFT_9899 [Chaetomium olivicolor]